MQPEAQIHTDRIDDLPLLLSQQQQMGIPQILNKIIQPHGNRQGLSVGWLTTTWLSYILSAGDDRMVEGGAVGRGSASDPVGVDS